MAKALAKELNFVYVDTGAMYRAAALFFMKEGLLANNEIDEKKIGQSLERMYIGFKYNPKSEEREIHLGGINVEKEIRSMEVAKKVSLVATIPEVRRKLVDLQQRLAQDGGVVMDGRDIGTVVLPGAEVKFFITADPEVRATRRLNELQENGVEAQYDEILGNIMERDRIDSNRAVAPLKKAEGAIVLDNSELTIDEQFQFLLSKVQQTIG